MVLKRGIGLGHGFGNAILSRTINVDESTALTGKPYEGNLGELLLHYPFELVT